MKRHTSVFLLILTAIAISAFVLPKPTQVEVDTTKSSVHWIGKKVTGQHTGTVQLKSGNLEMNGDRLAGGMFTADMSTIKNTDMKGEMSGKLMGHLQSPDFFSVAKFGVATFKITKVAPLKSEKYNYSITGNMEIKGISQELTFNAKVDVTEKKVTAMADLAVDRTKHDIRYGSGSFFDNLGDNTIDDEFMLTVNLVANR